MALTELRFLYTNFLRPSCQILPQSHYDIFLAYFQIGFYLSLKLDKLFKSLTFVPHVFNIVTACQIVKKRDLKSMLELSSKKWLTKIIMYKF